MSTPTSLVLPPGVEAMTLETARGPFAAHRVRSDGAVAHVLLIPGWTGSKEDFTALLPLLAAAGLDATAYDQRGQYETVGGADDDYSLAGFATDAAAVAAAATASRKSHVLGHSFGGLVAQQAAVLDPSQIASLSLLCTGPGALGDSPTRPLSPLVQAMQTMSLAEIRATLPRDPTLQPDIAEFIDKRFTANAKASLQAITQLLIDAPDIIDAVRDTGLPMWVGRGVDDDAWPQDVQAAMAKRLDTDLHVIDDAAHSPAVENPQGLVDAWLPFLKAHSLKEHSLKEHSPKEHS